MKVIILAGGFGKRMSPVTSTIPKPMVVFAGKPLLEHVIDYFLSNYGVTDFIICIYYLAEKIIAYFGDGSKFGIHITYIQENRPLGTAGAIKLAEQYIHEPFVVSYADVIRNVPLNQMISLHLQKKPVVSVAVYKNFSPFSKSRVLFDDDHYIHLFKEGRAGKSKSYEYIWSNASLYICNPEIFQYIPLNQKTDFASDIFPRIISKKGKILAFPYEGYCFDVGTLKKLKRLRNEINNYFPRGG